MKYTLLITLLLIAAPITLADNHSQYCDYLIQEIEMEVGDEVPGFVPYKNERVALFDLENTAHGHIITENAQVTSVGCEDIEDATYHVSIASTETIDAIFYSESPLGEFDNQKADKNIVVQGQSMGKQVKKSIAFASVKVLSWFGF